MGGIRAMLSKFYILMGPKCAKKTSPHHCTTSTTPGCWHRVVVHEPSWVHGFMLLVPKSDPPSVSLSRNQDSSDRAVFFSSNQFGHSQQFSLINKVFPSAAAAHWMCFLHCSILSNSRVCSAENPRSAVLETLKPARRQQSCHVQNQRNDIYFPHSDC